MRKFILTLAWCGLFAGTLAAENTDTVFCYYNKRGTVTSGSDWKSATNGEITPYSATFGVERSHVQVTNFVAHPPVGHTVTGWFWNGSQDNVVRKGMSELTEASDTNLTLTVAEDRLSCTATLKVSAVPSTARRALGAYFDYMPFTVTFRGNGATSGAMNSITNKNVDSSFTLPANAFEKTGYRFQNWENDLGLDFGDGAEVKGNDFWDDSTWQFHAELSAVWAANAYTVKFNGNGATGGSMSDQAFTYDSAKALTANAYTKDGYAFAGWATNATEGAVVYADKQTVRNLTAVHNEVVNLYARWTQKFKVTFREDEKFNETTPNKDGILKEEYVLKGESATPPEDPSHDGYRFTGWAGKYTQVAKNENVYANYQANSYRVVLHANDGSGATSQEDFVYGEEKALLPLSRTGHVLKGWAESEGSTEVRYQPGESVANLATEGEVHLYAIWTPISYEVVFDANGGEGTMVSVKLEYGQEYVVPDCEFTRAGCEFQSWQVLVGGKAVTNYLEGAVVSNLTSEASASVTLRADWTGYYTIAFDGNGGTGAMAAETVERDVGYQLPSNSFVRTGYDFAAWTNVSANVKPAACIADGATVTNLAEVGETCRLLALWDPHRYTVSFDANGGTGSVPTDMEFIYDQAKKLPESSLEPPLHYEFVGWGTNAEQTVGAYLPNESVSNLTAAADAQVTLYAIWRFIPSPISVALDCDNLYFENVRAEKWEVTDDTDRGTCATHLAAQGKVAQIAADISTSGTLTFWWKGQYQKGDIWLGEEDLQTELGVEFEDGQVVTNLVCAKDKNEEWQKVSVYIPKCGGQKIVFSHTSNGDQAWLDSVTWEPDSSEHPEPEAKDAVTISSAAVADGKFSLSFVSDEKFDYNLLTNANLLIDSWGVMATEKGTGETVVFDPPVVDGMPQLFYKVETIRKQD